MKIPSAGDTLVISLDQYPIIRSGIKGVTIEMACGNSTTINVFINIEYVTYHFSNKSGWFMVKDHYISEVRKEIQRIIQSKTKK